MNHKHTPYKIAAISILTLIFFAQSHEAHARFLISTWNFHHNDYDHHAPRKYRHHSRKSHHAHYRYRNNRHQGHQHGVIVDLPFGARIVFTSGTTYRTHKGKYYRRCQFDYYETAAPYGAIVYHLPKAHKKFKIKGHTYYHHNDVYYQKRHHGYEIIKAPKGRRTHGHAHHEASEQKSEITFTINIPNAHGEYTSVTIREANGGYYGPQGEYYEDFPRVAQLKTMYAH